MLTFGYSKKQVAVPFGATSSAEIILNVINNDRTGNGVPPQCQGLRNDWLTFPFLTPLTHSSCFAMKSENGYLERSYTQRDLK